MKASLAQHSQEGSIIADDGIGPRREVQMEGFLFCSLYGNCGNNSI